MNAPPVDLDPTRSGDGQDDPGLAGGLARLQREVARDLERLMLPPANWTAGRMGPDGAPLIDVAIVGAGMCGIAAAAALAFKGLRNVVLLDQARSGREGPWLTTARMETLRSPKQLPGVAMGLGPLTFRAWYEAQHGAAGFAALYKISNADWLDYLTWVRRVLDLPLVSDTLVRRLVPGPAHLRLDLDGPEGERSIFARRVVLANGRGGSGGLFVPEGVAADLWPDRAAHANEPIDLAPLAGRRIAVLGAGPAAWDNAAAALEHGAAKVDMYARRGVLPQVNKGRGSANPGFFEGYPALDAAEKWSLLVYLHDVQSPPPHESVHRALRHANFRIHLATPVLRAVRAVGGVELTLGPEGRQAEADFLICGTGFAIDLAREPLLAGFCAQIATWADRYDPPPTLRRPALSRFPWLGEGFELSEREPGGCPAIGRVHLFNHGAWASLGALASDIPGVTVGAERLATRIAQHVFREDFGDARERLEAFAEPELESTPFFDRGSFR